MGRSSVKGTRELHFRPGPACPGPGLPRLVADEATLVLLGLPRLVHSSGRRRGQVHLGLWSQSSEGLEQGWCARRSQVKHRLKGEGWREQGWSLAQTAGLGYFQCSQAGALGLVRAQSTQRRREQGHEALYRPRAGRQSTGVCGVASAGQGPVD